MDDILEHRLIRLLRDSALPSVAVRELHAALIAEGDGAPCSLPRLVEELRGRTDVFFLLEPDNPLGDATGWPQDVRAAYERALEEAGVVAGPRVALATRGRTGAVTFVREVGPGGRPSCSPARATDTLRDSLVEIWEASARSPDLRRAVAAALLDMPWLESAGQAD